MGFKLGSCHIHKAVGILSHSQAILSHSRPLCDATGGRRFTSEEGGGGRVTSEEGGSLTVPVERPGEMERFT
jgi:hypothetical protein